MVSAGHVNIPEICVKLFTAAITGFVSRVAMALPLASKHCKAIVPWLNAYYQMFGLQQKSKMFFLPFERYFMIIFQDSWPRRKSCS
ncbi:MAG: hypothetical protein V8T87_01000 [Victivallales bacterium]